MNIVNKQNSIEIEFDTTDLAEVHSILGGIVLAKSDSLESRILFNPGLAKLGLALAQFYERASDDDLASYSLDVGDVDGEIYVSMHEKFLREAQKSYIQSIWLNLDLQQKKVYVENYFSPFRITKEMEEDLIWNADILLKP